MRWCFPSTLHLDSLVSLSPFSLFRLRPLRGSKVASAHIPFYLSSPKERKGRLVMLRKSGASTGETAPCKRSARSSRQMCRQWNKWIRFCSFCFCVKARRLRCFRLSAPAALPPLSPAVLLSGCCFALLSLLAARLHRCVFCCSLHKHSTSSLAVAVKTALRLCFAWLNVPLCSECVRVWCYAGQRAGVWRFVSQCLTSFYHICVCVCACLVCEICVHCRTSYMPTCVCCGCGCFVCLCHLSVCMWPSPGRTPRKVSPPVPPLGAGTERRTGRTNPPPRPLPPTLSTQVRYVPVMFTHLRGRCK